MRKGFSFEQLALILIVVLGLVIVVVLVATQAGKAGGSFGTASGNVQESVEQTGSLITSCPGNGGSCKASCATTEISIGKWDCPQTSRGEASSAKSCCRPK